MKTRKAAVRPAKLDIWQQRLADSDVTWKSEMARMDRREHLYNGDRKLRPLVKGDTKADGSPENTPHVRNIIFENIESQVSSSICTCPASIIAICAMTQSRTLRHAVRSA